KTIKIIPAINTKSCVSSLTDLTLKIFFQKCNFRYFLRYSGMMIRKRFLLFFTLLFSSGGIFSQTGVFWFGDSASTSVNNRIISIKENSDGNLYLLGKASDSDYKNIHPYFAVCDTKGNLRSQKTVATTNDFFELNNFVICEENKIRIFGTEKVDNRLTISMNTINPQGEMQSVDAMMTTTTTLTGDVCQLNDETAIFAKTVQSSSTGKFHISIYKYNIHNDQQIWYKTLSAEGNEEASKIYQMKDGSFILLAKLYNDELSSYTPLIYKISSEGEMIWKKNPEAYSTFAGQGIAEGKNKSLIYCCSTGEEKDISGTTKMLMLDSNGSTISTNEISAIKSNGILALNNGNFLLYGSHVQQAGMYIITKACYKIYDPGLKKIKEDEMGMFDGPDAYLPSLAISAWPTASDFLNAIQLKDGRIACVGRVYMPDETSPDKIIFSDRINKAFLVLMDVNGKFREK
ncbi:MAG TPA: hypothetical protein VFJ43_11370, partial [Bacteroidia bacterium]|nr:hypothetical protein [Bacteroidia bacterium]